MMENRVTISDYRKKARASLEHQWGMNAWLVFLSMLVVGAIQSVFDGASPFSSESSQGSILAFLVEHLLLFAFTYALFYIALVVVRGGKAQTGQLLAVFQQKYFGSILVINLISTFVTWAINSLILLPIFFIGGINTYTQLLFNSNMIPANIADSEVLNIGFVLLMLAVAFLSLLITSIVGGLFQFAAWTKFDYPDLSVFQCLKYAWFLLKGRIGIYILLQLSFIGWYLLGMLALFIGLLWVIAYVNVTIAGFYDQARIEKGSPYEYFS